MKEKLLAIWSKVQPILAGAYAKSPLVAGIVLGYFGSPIIKLAIHVASSLIKWILG